MIKNINEIDYQMASPAPELAHVVESFWMMVNTSDETKSIVILPDGRVDIHFFYSNTEAFNIGIAGLECEPSHAVIESGSVMFAVSFTLLAVEYVLKTSIAPIFNHRSRLPDDFWGMTKEDLNNFEHFCRKVSAQISKLINPLAFGNDTPKMDAKKLKMFELIYASKGSASVKDISTAAHWSARQINRYFNQWFGLSLKSYCTLLRFRASFTQLKYGKLFPESEFSDQAHFIKEIKKYSGYTPKELHKNKDDRFIQLSTIK